MLHFDNPRSSFPFISPPGQPSSSSSAFSLPVGTDTSPGSIWMNDSYNGHNGDLPYTNAGCTTNDSLPTVGFAQVVTEACPALETGAYGLPAQVVGGNGDIPAVEFDVVGGANTVVYLVARHRWSPSRSTEPERRQRGCPVCDVYGLGHHRRADCPPKRGS